MSKLCDTQESYTFDDFVLVPNFSTIKSRKEPDISFRSKNYSQNIPIFSSPMNTITEGEMIETMLESGANAVLHRYLDISSQIAICNNINKKYYNPKAEYFVAIGASGDFLERADELYKNGINKFCVDVANGHSQICSEATEKIKKRFNDAIVMAGNVCSYDGAIKLAEAGCDFIRIGIGPGSMCTTRLVTGHGVPQLSAVEDCAKIKSLFPNVALISDGGIKRSGDIVKALAIGADFVMIGSLLSGTIQTPGEIIKDGSNNYYKYYAGMASELARSGWFETSKTSYVPEGISTKVPYVGRSAKDVINELVGGLKVGMSYSDAHNVVELRKKAQWRRVTSFGFAEGIPHGKKD